MTHAPASRIVCAGCDLQAPAQEPYPFRCPNAGRGDDCDHVMVRQLDLTRARFPRDGETNPFVRYRQLFHAWHVARANGMSDADYVTLVESLDRAVAAVDGHGFAKTPFARNAALSEQLRFSSHGGVWIKNETDNVSGSHKARHLMGVAIHLEVVERLGLALPSVEGAGVPSARITAGAPDPRAGAGAARPGPAQRLAIASCGNAALAAAVVARAAHRALDVFVPPDAEPPVLARLEQLGATLHVCPRQHGVTGDPCMHAFREAVAAGALPFGCQGNENGLAVEGGHTLGYEMAVQLGGRPLDHLVIQVGGGALASACIQAFHEAHVLDVLPKMPRVYAVQTRAAHPLARAYELLIEQLGAAPSREAIDAAMSEAACHRSRYMWPWEETPTSIARGILDDETYDWLAVVRGMIETGGHPILVSEERLREAHQGARTATGTSVCETGSAGLAGLIELCSHDSVGHDEAAAVLFTGAARHPAG